MTRESVSDRPPKATSPLSVATIDCIQPRSKALSTIGRQVTPSFDVQTAACVPLEPTATKPGPPAVMALIR